MKTYSEPEVLALAEAAYARGRPAGEPNWRRAALLVIDMQAEFVEPGLCAYWVPAATRLIPGLARVLAAARVVFGSDLTATNDPALHEAELRTMRYGFAWVLSEQEILHAVGDLT